MYQHPNQNRDDSDAHIQEKAVSEGLSGSCTNRRIAAVVCMCNVLYRGTIYYSASFFSCTSCLRQAQRCGQEAASKSAERRSGELVLFLITASLTRSITWHLSQAINSYANCIMGKD